MTVHAVRLNHAVLFVADLDRSAAFYPQVFGMTVMAKEPRANAAFLRLPRSGNPWAGVRTADELVPVQP